MAAGAGPRTAENYGELYPSYKTAMLEEDVLLDRYSLMELEYLLSLERIRLLETKKPLQHELLLNRPALFCKDVYLELQHLQSHAQVILANIRQFLDTWESINYWSDEQQDKRYWDLKFVHEAMRRPSVFTMEPGCAETPPSSEGVPEEEEELGPVTPAAAQADPGYLARYACHLDSPRSVTPEEWEELENIW